MKHNLAQLMDSCEKSSHPVKYLLHTSVYRFLFIDLDFAVSVLANR